MSVKRLIAVFVVLIIISNNLTWAAGLTVGQSYLKVKGPAVIELKNLTDTNLISLDDETIIHLPQSAKYVLVQNQTYSTDQLRQEVRAYSVQQTVFWVVTMFVLWGAISQWR